MRWSAICFERYNHLFEIFLKKRFLLFSTDQACITPTSIDIVIKRAIIFLAVNHNFCQINTVMVSLLAFLRESIKNITLLFSFEAINDRGS